MTTHIATHGWNFAPWIAWATVAAAIGTVVAAGATFYLARKTLAMVTAARDDASASHEIAREAVEQGQRDRAAAEERKRDRIERQARGMTAWSAGLNSGAAGLYAPVNFKNDSTGPITELGILVQSAAGPGNSDVSIVPPNYESTVQVTPRIRSRSCGSC